MQLILSNQQGELAPLEIGLHVLGAVPKEQGKAGGGLQAYADQIRKNRGYISQLKDAAEVATSLVNQRSYLNKVMHLYGISKASRELWPTLAEYLLKQEWSAADAKYWVLQVREFNDIPEHWHDIFLPYIPVVKHYLRTHEFSPGTAQKLVELADATIEMIGNYNVEHEIWERKFEKWLSAIKVRMHETNRITHHNRHCRHFSPRHEP